MEKIYCIFSIDNQYDQPKNNLVIAWSEKPSIDVFASAFGIPNLKNVNIYEAIEKHGEHLQKITRVYNGEEVRIDHVDYRFEEVEIGKLLNRQ